MSNVRNGLWLSLLTVPLLVAACGAPPSPAAAPRAASAATVSQVLKRVDATSPLERPVTANAVLTYGHAVARMLDTKAAFIHLTGSRIGASGAPLRDGEWTLTYVGTETPVATNPYVRTARRIAITVPNTGRPKVEVFENEGMPLGVCFLDRPIPDVDSPQVLDLARQGQAGHPAHPAEPTGYRLTLAGLMGGQNLQRLVWKISKTATQGPDHPLMFDANSGEVITK